MPCNILPFFFWNNANMTTSHALDLLRKNKPKKKLSKYAQPAPPVRVIDIVWPFSFLLLIEICDDLIMKTCFSDMDVKSQCQLCIEMSHPLMTTSTRTRFWIIWISRKQINVTLRTNWRLNAGSTSTFTPCFIWIRHWVLRSAPSIIVLINILILRRRSLEVRHVHQFPVNHRAIVCSSPTIETIWWQNFRILKTRVRTDKTVKQTNQIKVILISYLNVVLLKWLPLAENE